MFGIILSVMDTVNATLRKHNFAHDGFGTYDILTPCFHCLLTYCSQLFHALI
jgi:hypothetical protein